MVVGGRSGSASSWYQRTSAGWTPLPASTYPRQLGASSATATASQWMVTGGLSDAAHYSEVLEVK